MRSWGPRLEAIRIAVKLIEEKPLFGHGLNSFMVKRADTWLKLPEKKHERGELHCDIIELAVELGSFGVGLFIAVIVGSVWHGGDKPVFIAMLISILISGLFYYPLRRPSTGMLFWIILGVLAA